MLESREADILFDRQMAKNPTALGDPSNAASTDLVWRRPVMGVSLRDHPGSEPDEAHDGFDGGGLTGAVPAEKRYDLASVKLEAYPMQHVTEPMKAMDALRPQGSRVVSRA